jgi:hypothetical protein
VAQKPRKPLKPGEVRLRLTGALSSWASESGNEEERLEPASADNWDAKDYTKDVLLTTLEPAKDSEHADGRVYIVRNIFGDYYGGTLGYGSGQWSSNLKHAKRFYNGQSAWGAARKSIYPATILILRKRNEK